jgi:hypothetical protein
MLTTDDLKTLTGMDTSAWKILLEEAERYGYDDEKVRNMARGFKLGWNWAGTPWEQDDRKDKANGIV